MAFDIFRTEDNTVSKYIHDDGSETAIKMVKSVQNIFNPLTNEIESRESDRNKYSVFISSSVGCFMKCKFCHLTLKNSEFIKLEEDQIFNNLKEGLFLDKLPGFKNYYDLLIYEKINSKFDLTQGQAIELAEVVK